MIERCRSSKTAVVNIEAFRHLICHSREKGKLRVCWTAIHKKRKFSCVLRVHSQFLCSLAKFDLANRGLRQPILPHTYARLFVFDKTLAQPDFAVVNGSEAVMSVFYSPVLSAA